MITRNVFGILVEKQVGEFMESLQILFIRHAQTNYSDIGDRDNCDGDLTEIGEKQCDILGERLKALPIDAYISSSLLRAFKTATGVCRAKGDKPLLYICPEIIECGCTEGYYGCSEEYLKKFYNNTEMLGSLYSPEKHEFPCQTDEDNKVRARKFIDYITKNYTYGQRVAVFSHYGMLEYLIPTALGIEPKQFSLSFENISVTEVDIAEDGTRTLKFANKTEKIG